MGRTGEDKNKDGGLRVSRRQSTPTQIGTIATGHSWPGIAQPFVQAVGSGPLRDARSIPPQVFAAGPR